MEGFVKFYLAAVMLITLLPMMLGQDKPKSNVAFYCQCEDVVGGRYAVALRDLIARSPRYVQASEFIGGGGSTPQWNYGIHVITLDPSTSKSGGYALIAVTFTIGPSYMSQSVQYCPQGDVASCASDTLADLDRITNK